MERTQIYDLIDAERAYQDKRWGPTETQGKHSITEFFAYIEDYIGEAKHILAREGKATAYPKVRRIMPKIAAMMVASMEQNGATGREEPPHDCRDHAGFGCLLPEPKGVAKK